jgi:signal transduction histidine kinase
LLAKLHEEALRGVATSISRSAVSLNDRIDELLDLAKGEMGMLELKLDLVDLTQLLGDAAESMTPVAVGRGQSLVLDLPTYMCRKRAIRGAGSPHIHAPSRG